jgi:hypothetical protein
MHDIGGDDAIFQGVIEGNYVQTDFDLCVFD